MLSSDELSCYSSQVMLGVRNLKVHFKFVGGRHWLTAAKKLVFLWRRENTRREEKMYQFQVTPSLFIKYLHFKKDRTEAFTMQSQAKKN